MQQSSAQAVNVSRRAFAKAGVMAPVVMSLASKTVLGASYHCTVSGNQSGNHSGGHDWSSDCGVGYSPGGWADNADKTGPGTPDGYCVHWLQAGVVPFTTKLVVVTTTIQERCVRSGTKYTRQRRTITATTITLGGVASTTTVTGAWGTVQSNLTSCTAAAPNVNTVTTKYIVKHSVDTPNPAVYDKIIEYYPTGATATSFASAFGGGGSDSMWETLDSNRGGLIWHAIADYLNAKLFESGHASGFGSVYDDVTSEDIVNLYKLANGGPAFYSSTGSLIDANFNLGSYPGTTIEFRVIKYLEMIHH